MKQIISLISILLPLASLSHGYTREHANLWPILTHHFKLKALPEEEPMIAKHIQWYQKHPESLTQTLKRAQLYLHYITVSLVIKDLPSEIALIPMIESHYNPFAHSPAGASGLWQMMPSLGSGYQLNQSHWTDERRDIIQSTEKAISHLIYLHKIFNGSWRHAFYAYNAGEGRIRQIEKRAHQEKATLTSKLPNETKQYIPKIIALQRIMSNPNRYQINLPPLSNAPYFTAVTLKNPVAFEQISTTCQLNPALLRMLNPSARRLSLKSPHQPSYTLLLPATNAYSCQAKLSKANTQQTWTYHQASGRQHLSFIAKKHDMSLQYLKELNWIDTKETTSSSTLLIHSNRKSHDTHTHSIGHEITADWVAGPRQHIHTTQPHDTLSTIAKRYKTKVESLKYWNKSAKLNPLQPNQRLIVWSSPIEKSYQVKPGDSLSKLARQFKISESDIIRNNKLTSTTIKANQVLKIVYHAHSH